MPGHPNSWTRSMTSAGRAPIRATSPPCTTRSMLRRAMSAATASSAVRLPWISETTASRIAGASRLRSGPERSRVGGDVDRVSLEHVEGDDLERPLMGCGEDDERGHVFLVRPSPGPRGHAPAVARLEAGEGECRDRRAQVVADALLVLEKFGGHYRADR